MLRFLPLVIAVVVVISPLSLLGQEQDSVFLPMVRTGSKIAFVREYSSSNSEIFVMDFDGSNQVRLTNNVVWDHHPTWSPNGGKIAFVRDRDGVNRRTDLYVMNVDGTEQMLLAYGPIGYMDWSPDSSKLVFTVMTMGKTDIYVINADGTDLTNITNSAEIDEASPKWSPDGSLIAFTQRDQDYDYGIYVMNVDDSDKRLVTEIPQLSPISWSPNGDKILLEFGYLEYTSDIYTVNVDGSDLTNLTNHPDHDSNATWSPDGSMIAFTSWSRLAGDSYDVYVMNADGTGRTRLTFDSSNEHRPSWSPDSKRLTFFGCPGSCYVYVISADGTGLTNLTDDPAIEDEPADSWSVWSR